MHNIDPLSMVGRRVKVGFTGVHLILKYDAPRKAYITRNMLNRSEGPISLDTFTEALTDGIIRILRGEGTDKP